MINKLFAIKDRKASFWSPFTAVNEMVAKRDFALSVNNDSRLNNIASDLDLYVIGTFDDQCAEVTSSVEFLCSGNDVLEVNNE